MFALILTPAFALITMLFARFGNQDVYEDYLAASSNHAELETRLRHIERATTGAW
ncbi:hypothetical protein BH10PSE17_BH10PSE17_18370 [soil metagenome]